MFYTQIATILGIKVASTWKVGLSQQWMLEYMPKSDQVVMVSYV